jgi:TolA-binding protein
MRKSTFATLLLASIATGPVTAQSDPLAQRVGKLEKEMTAVQRKVFPNGAAIEPEIGNNAPAAAAGNPASSPVADLNARVDALESQLQILTGQVETDGNRVKKLEDAIKAYDARLKALEGTGPVVADNGNSAAASPATPKPATAAPKLATAAAKPAASAKIDPNRKAAIEAVEIPSTGDGIEDAYTYGFRLWTAKLYPEAQMKLKEFVAKYPNHKRASYAQNLLGRAYLDEGKPALASVAFYDNYQKMPKGERASESLYWLGMALTKLKKPADACKVYKEFDDVYADKAGADLKAKVTKGKTDAKCAA